MRLPRKEKKRAKKIVAKKSALKTAISAMVTAQSAIQVAILNAQPRPKEMTSAQFILERGFKYFDLTLGLQASIATIMSEPPNSWKDFLKLKD